MSALGRHYRFVVWNGSGLSLGSVTMRYRRWWLDAQAALQWAGANSVDFTTGAQSSNTGQATPLVDNSTVGGLGLSGVVEIPSMSGTASGPVEIWLQQSPDGGTNWPDSPDLRRGILVASTFYDNVSNPAARDLQLSL